METDIDVAFNEMHADCKKPYAREILNGTIDIKGLNADGIATAISTAAYLGRPTEEWANEFVWRCGGNADEYGRYFGDAKGFNGPPEVWNELKLAGYEWEQDEKLRRARFCVRFRYVALEDIIRVGNLRLFKLRVSEQWPFTDDDCYLMYKLDRLEMLLLVTREIYIGYAIGDDALRCVRHIREQITSVDEINSMIINHACKCLRYYAPAWANHAEVPNLLLKVSNAEVLRILHNAGWPITPGIYNDRELNDDMLNYLISLEVMPPESWIFRIAGNLAPKYIRLGCVHLQEENRQLIYSRIINSYKPDDLEWIKAMYESKTWDLELEMTMKHRCICLSRMDMFEYFRSMGVEFGRTEIWAIINTRQLEMLRTIPVDKLMRQECLWEAVNADWPDGVRYIHDLGVPFDNDMYLCSMTLSRQDIKKMIADELFRS